MPNQAPPIINGHRYSFASIEFEVDGLIIVGARSINYREELIPGVIWGEGSHKVGRTPGKYDASCDFDVYRREWDELRSSLGQSFGLKSFDVRVMYQETPTVVGADPQVVIDHLIGGRITKVEAPNSEGPDPSVIKLSCDVMRIVWDAAKARLFLEGTQDVRDTIPETLPPLRVPGVGELA